jgi:hypothetical protein
MENEMTTVKSMGEDDILGSSISRLATSVHRRALEVRKRDNDPGFWGTVRSRTVDGSIILHNAGRVGKKFFRSDDFSSYAEEGYDWREVAERYKSGIPKEVLEGSRSSVETDARLRNYEKECYARGAMEDHPVASFFGRLVGTGIDLWVISQIPVIGGFSIASGTAAGRLVGNSILKKAVTNGVSFALDMGELGVLRTMVDDRVTFGESVNDIPKEMMVGALIGGGFGTAGGVWSAMGKKKSSQGPKAIFSRIGEQVEEGTHLPHSPALGNDTYGSVEEYQSIVSQQMKAVDDNMAVHELPPLGDDTTRNFVKVVGGIGEKSATEKSSTMALSRLATDRLTRSFANPSKTVSSLARLLHDNHLLSLGEGGEALPLDVAARTATNTHKGTVAKIVEDIFQKISQDRNLPPLSRDEIRQMIGKVHLNGGSVPDGLNTQLAAVIGNAYGQVKASFFDAMEETFLDLQTMKHGPALLEQSKNNLARAEKQVSKTRQDYEKFVGTKDGRVAKEIARELAAAEGRGVIPLSEEAVGKAREKNVAAIKKQFENLRRKVVRSSGDYGGAMDGILDAMEDSGLAGKEALDAVDDMVKAGEQGKGTLDDAIAALDAMEERAILEVNKGADNQIAGRRKVWEHAKSVAEKNLERTANKMRRDMEVAEERLANEKALFDDRSRGKFSYDKDEFLQKEDAHYIRRIYDVRKIMRYPEEFIGDITKNLMAQSNIMAKQANTIAHNLYNELMNGYGRGGKLGHAITARGGEKARSFNFPTEVVRDWLVDDIQEIADSIADTLVPDHLLMKNLGTYEASSFFERVAKDVDDLVTSGKLKVGDRKSYLDDAMDTIQALIDNVRYLGKLPPGSIKSSTVAWQASSIARSLTTAVAMGGAPLLSIFDAASTILNKGFFSAVQDDFVPFLKFMSNRRFREAVRNHPDMASLSGWLNAMTKKGTISRMADYGIPVGAMTRVTEAARSLAEFQFKWTGATALFNAMHMVADYGSLLTLSRISENAAKGIPLSATEKNVLSLARISGEDALKIGNSIAKHGTEVNGVRYLNFHDWEDGTLAFSMQYGANNVTMNSILLPSSEVPKFVRTPLGELIFQYKKFYFAAVDRCFLPAINRLAQGELTILSSAFIMVTMGGLKELLARLVAGKEPPSFSDFWMYGVGNSDVLPFIGEAIRDIGLGFHSKGVVGKQSLERLVDNFFVPPAAGIIKRGPGAAHGTYNMLAGQPLTKQQINALKRSLPFNNTVYFNFLMNKLNSLRKEEKYHDYY